jgi:hypothetical protein
MTMKLLPRVLACLGIGTAVTGIDVTGTPSARIGPSANVTPWPGGHGAGSGWRSW